MDDLTSQFGGGLSLNAAEFKPRGVGGGSSSNSSRHAADVLSPQSDLKATAVKEFVPGQGWNASGTLRNRAEPVSYFFMLLFVRKSPSSN